MSKVLTKLQKEACIAVERIQSFDLGSLPRKEEFGTALSFESTVEPASRLIDIFKEIAVDFIGDLPEQMSATLRDQANSVFNILNQIIEFKPESGDPDAFRKSVTGQLSSHYDQTFNSLYNIISYLTSRQRDFGALERQARAAVQNSIDQANALKEILLQNKEESQRILFDIRQTAAEQGVSQQAHWFKTESELHNSEAGRWQKYTILSVSAFFFLAITSVFFHKISFIRPETTYDSVQLVASKVLIFAILAYLTGLCARNFLSHKHNSIVNKHRQNALLTYRSLSEASSDEKGRDVILNHAAACIFAPQDTGYTKSGSSNDNASVTQIASLIPKIPSAPSG